MLPPVDTSIEWTVACAQIRDLVARYNVAGDSGRFDDLVVLFDETAVMEARIRGELVRFEGPGQIRELFEQTKDEWAESADRDGSVGYIRHHVSTHQIDFVDADHATGRSYFLVIMAHGLDHWGRYTDRYVRRDGRWLFEYRKAFEDDRNVVINEGWRP